MFRCSGVCSKSRRSGNGPPKGPLVEVRMGNLNPKADERYASAERLDLQSEQSLHLPCPQTLKRRPELSGLAEADGTFEIIDRTGIRLCFPDEEALL